MSHRTVLRTLLTKTYRDTLRTMTVRANEDRRHVHSFDPDSGWCRGCVGYRDAMDVCCIRVAASCGQA